MTRASDQVFSYDTPLVSGTVIDRPNRFTLRVGIDDRTERAYLRNSGGLDTVLEPGRPVLCRPAANPDRATDHDAVAVRVDGTWVTVDATLPNAVFAACIDHGHLPRFEGYDIDSREPPLPDEGRTDFRLRTPTGEDAYVEVKSNTHVVEGVAKFPDRPTQRGRRHLESLLALSERGTECHVVFVIQRPDANRLRPFYAVDHVFGELLGRAADAGVTISAVATSFDPPTVRLHDAAVPVELNPPNRSCSRDDDTPNKG